MDRAKTTLLQIWIVAILLSNVASRPSTTSNTGGEPVADPTGIEQIDTPDEPVSPSSDNHRSSPPQGHHRGETSHRRRDNWPRTGRFQRSPFSHPPDPDYYDHLRFPHYDPFFSRFPPREPYPTLFYPGRRPWYPWRPDYDPTFPQPYPLPDPDPTRPYPLRPYPFRPDPFRPDPLHPDPLPYIPVPVPYPVPCPWYPYGGPPIIGDPPLPEPWDGGNPPFILHDRAHESSSSTTREPPIPEWDGARPRFSQHRRPPPRDLAHAMAEPPISEWDGARPAFRNH